MSKKPLSPVKKRRKKKLIIFIIELLILLVLLAVLFVWLKLGKITHEDINEDALGISDEVDPELMSGYTNIALFGLDNRTMGNLDSGNSDTIMILSIDNSNGEINIISVYRDTMLAQQEDEDGDFHYRKANAAFSYGGAEEAVRMLNTNLDLNITDYVTVDFQALVDAIDAVGGIEMEITQKEAKLINTRIDELEEWTGTSSSHLNGAGTYTLDGVQATAYCRLRKTALGDFGRAQRQRKVLGTLFKKVKSGGLVTANAVVDAVVDEISTSLSNSEILGLAATCIGYSLSDTAGFPYSLTTGTYGSLGSLDVPCTLESNVKALYSSLFDEDDYSVSSTVKEISSYIINYTGCDEDDATTYNIEDDGLSETKNSTDSSTDQEGND